MQRLSFCLTDLDQSFENIFFLDTVVNNSNVVDCDANSAALLSSRQFK
jgi:hypothetical protein